MIEKLVENLDKFDIVLYKTESEKTSRQIFLVKNFSTSFLKLDGNLLSNLFKTLKEVWLVRA
jgi:hypothetical protein